jgi:dCTP deaminase
MILSDFDLMNVIKSKRLVVDPFVEELVKENGIDLRLSDEIARQASPRSDFVMDPTKEEDVKAAYKIEKNAKQYIIGPHEHVLLSSMEFIGMPDDLVGFVELRSTWGRHGLSIPPTIIDVGFRGTITLEVVNNAPYKIVLRPGMRFAHAVFAKTNSKVEKTYKGTYNEQRGIKLPKVMKE